MLRSPSKGKEQVSAVGSRRSKCSSSLSAVIALTELAFTCRLNGDRVLSKAVQLSSSDTLKIILTTQEGKTAKRPHQAFLEIKDVNTGLETSYAFSVKESGKGKVELVSRWPWISIST